PHRIWVSAHDPALLRPLAEDLSAHAAILSLSAGRRRYRLAGPRCVEILAKGIALDLEGAGLPPGHAAETQLHRMPVLLLRRPDSFELFISRSFATSFEARIADAAIGSGWQPAA